VFAALATTLLPAIIAGVMISGILASTMSTSDSQLLVSASVISKNFFHGLLKKNATDKQVLVVSKVTVIVAALIGILFALNENSTVFGIVSYAWAGFGATFGPLVIMSLFWKRMNKWGALAGMVSGAATIIVWKELLKPIGGVFGIYELLPGFIVSLVLIVAVSLLTKKPSDEIVAEFDSVKTSSEEE
jgi:sodium/proline symporter